MLGGASLWLLFLCTPAKLQAQWVPTDDDYDYGFGRTFDKVGDPDLVPPFLPRFRLQSVTLYHGFSSFGVPVRRNLSGVPRSFANFGADGQYGGSATFGWHEQVAGTDFSLVYRPQASGQYRHSDWNRFYHTWHLNFGRNKSFTLMKGRRWDWTFGLNSGMNTFEQWFYDPPVVRGVANAPASLDELFARSGAGEFSNDEIASILTGAPVVEKRADINQDLSQALSANVRSQYSYRYSSRLSFNLGAGANRFQLLSGRRRGASGDNRIFLPSGTYGNINSGVQYKLSRRTNVGGDVGLSRSFSRFASAYYTRQTAFVNRQLGRRWAVSLRGGVGQVHGFGPRVGNTWLAGGSLSYAAQAHSFNFSFHRNVGDSFGLGSRTTLNSRMNWNWQRPGRDWSLSAHVARTDSDLTSFQNYSYWWSGLSWTRRLSRSTFATTHYSYVNNSSPFTGLFGNVRGHRIMFSFVWVPQPLGEVMFYPGLSPQGFRGGRGFGP